jgi:hypothetical protein
VLGRGKKLFGDGTKIALSLEEVIAHPCA